MIITYVIGVHDDATRQNVPPSAQLIKDRLLVTNSPRSGVLSLNFFITILSYHSAPTSYLDPKWSLELCM